MDAALRALGLKTEAGRLIQQQAGIGGVHDGRRTARLGAEDRGRETYTAAGRYRGCTRWTPHCAPWGWRQRGGETYTAAGRYRGCTRWTPHCAPWG